MMRSQERSRAEHPSLHFIEYEQRSVFSTELLRGLQILALRNSDSALRLHRFHDECRELSGAEFCFQRLSILERNLFRSGQHRPEPFAPEWTSHEGEGAARQSVECSLGVEQTGSSCVGARKLDCALHAFTSRTGKENFGKLPACQFAKLGRQFTCSLANVALQH